MVYLLNMVIFNSYVKLPEGIYIYNNQFNLETTFSYILLLWTSKPNPLGAPSTTVEHVTLCDMRFADADGRWMVGWLSRFQPLV